MPPRKRTNLEAWQLCYKVTGSDEPGHSLGSTNVKPENAASLSVNGFLNKGVV